MYMVFMDKKSNNNNNGVYRVIAHYVSFRFELCTVQAGALDANNTLFDQHFHLIQIVSLRNSAECIPFAMVINCSAVATVV